MTTAICMLIGFCAGVLAAVVALAWSTPEIDWQDSTRGQK